MEIREVYEKCLNIKIKPGFKVDDKGSPTEASISADICVKAKDGGHSYLTINSFGKNLKEAENKIIAYATALWSVQV